MDILYKFFLLAPISYNYKQQLTLRIKRIFSTLRLAK